VVLTRDQWATWLDPETPSAEILKPSPAGLLKVEEMPRA
jgi:putative SOS response-associated peptidase YedK